MSTEIRLVQCLCQNRHGILALPYEPGVTTTKNEWSCLEDDPILTQQNAAALLRKTIERLIKRNVLNPWCGICGSREFHYEDERMAAKSWDEANKSLADNGRRQAVARAFFKAIRN